MLITLGNGEVLRHLNHQEDWLKLPLYPRIGL